jgi:hypothetical protein
MRTTLALLAGLGLAALSSSLVGADDPVDDKEARTEAAERYSKVVPMKELMEDMAEQMGKNLPPAKAAAMKELMVKKLDIQALERESKQGLVRHFTVKELNAMADFYGSPEGRSILKKFGVYMAEMQPIILREIRKASRKE